MADHNFLVEPRGFGVEIMVARELLDQGEGLNGHAAFCVVADDAIEFAKAILAAAAQVKAANNA